MAKLTQTVREARDHILKRLNSLGSTEYETLVLECLNHALVFVASAHDWKFLQKKTTVTTTDATGVVELPSDCDRILVFHAAGANYLLTQMDPLPFEQLREDDDVDEPMGFCVQGYVQDTTTEAPNLQIEIYTAPDSGADYICWYIKELDELTTATLDTVPLMPTALWELVIRKAMLEMLKVSENPPSSVGAEERHLIATLNILKQREDRGSSRRVMLQTTEKVQAYRAQRGL
jgi:hypothetical protein